jgi:hypothetical protein
MMQAQRQERPQHEVRHAQLVLHSVHPSDDLMPYVRSCVHKAGLDGATVEVWRKHGWSLGQTFCVSARIDDGHVELRADMEDRDLYTAIARALELLRRRLHFHRFGTSAPEISTGEGVRVDV